VHVKKKFFALLLMWWPPSYRVQPPAKSHCHYPTTAPPASVQPELSLSNLAACILNGDIRDSKYHLKYLIFLSPLPPGLPPTLTCIHCPAAKLSRFATPKYHAHHPTPPSLPSFRISRKRPALPFLRPRSSRVPAAAHSPSSLTCP